MIVSGEENKVTTATRGSLVTMEDKANPSAAEKGTVLFCLTRSHCFELPVVNA